MWSNEPRIRLRRISVALGDFDLELETVNLEP
jgi:hypothetical protein